MDATIPTNVVRCYPTKKPWVTSDLKVLLNRKKKAFRVGDQVEVKQVQRGLKHRLKESKDAYRKKLEENFGRNTTKDVLSGTREIASFQRKVMGGGVFEGKNTSPHTPPKDMWVD